MQKGIIRIAALGAIVVLVTIVLGCVNVEQKTISTLRFWSVLAPVVFAEIITTIGWVRLVGQTRAKNFPMLFAFSGMPIFYFIFTLLMLFTYPVKDFSTQSLLTIQAIALVVVLFIVVGFAMAADSITAHATETAAAFAPRTSFRITVGGIVEILNPRFGSDAETAKLISQLQEAARYAADTVPGGESFDSELEERLAALETAAPAAEAEEIRSKISLILSSFRKREAFMKTLR